MKKILSIGLLTLSVLLTACSSDENDKKDNGNSASATINGTAWNATKINSVTLIKVKSEKQQRFDINIQDNAQMLSLACVSELTTADAMPIKAYNFDENAEDEDNMNALFINTYLIDGSTFTEHFVQTGKLTITSMDPANKTVSGTFSFTSKKVGSLQTKVNTPEIFEVKNGTFTNLSYTVITQP
ncbi:DUF6252 family protein [Flavobacterium sp. B183]|uniref:DUF6252 family protein n=1 Tax=Flavobacterium sp. B183 TaxID=907046 RepID=UPI00201F14D3|nr:DUF6252 family protein [Flavobacterium sp. B183]URC11090.1 DUF6252 family protein [Flavobacterium sp. B183]